MMDEELAKYYMQEKEQESGSGDSAEAGEEHSSQFYFLESLSMLGSILGHTLPTALHIKYYVHAGFYFPCYGRNH